MDIPMVNMYSLNGFLNILGSFFLAIEPLFGAFWGVCVCVCVCVEGWGGGGYLIILTLPCTQTAANYSSHCSSHNF